MSRHLGVIGCAASILLGLTLVPSSQSTGWAASEMAPSRSPAAVVVSQTDDLPHAEDDAESHGVISVFKNPDGSTRVVEYTPAVGVDAGSLYEALDDKGVNGLQDPTAPAMQATCSYAYLGSSRTLCPVLSWTKGGHTRPRVYFADHTSANWPVQSTTANWNNVVGIDVYHSQSCVAGSHCINMWSNNYGNSCWQGASEWSYDAQGHFIDGSVNIWLNEFTGRGVCGNRTISYYKNAAGYQQNACHEQGHALGLGHSSSTGSCVYTNIINRQAARYPSADDRALLRWVYGPR